MSQLGSRQELDALLNPQSIAIVGASRNPASFGHLALHNLQKYGYEGRLMAVHATESAILNVRCYPNVADLPETPDLCVIALRADLVAENVAACAERGVGVVTVVGSGFAEWVPPAFVQERIAATWPAGMRLLGPNTSGAAGFASRAV